MKSSSLNKKNNGLNWTLAVLFFILFALMTYLVTSYDVQAIGPEGTSVGLSALNGRFAAQFPYNEMFYKISKYLGYVAILLCIPFAITALVQFFRDGFFKGLDRRLLVMCLCLVILAAFYVGFEFVDINYRPVVMPGEGLEKSFPSSHTMLGVGVFLMVAFMADFVGELLKNQKIATLLKIVMPILAVAMVLTRLFSGVHWFSDILAGAFAGLFIALLARSGIKSVE